MTHKEIVMKLIGEIRPIGETNEDNKRFENLKELSYLIEELNWEMNRIAVAYRDSPEFSLRRASEYAREWMGKTGIID